MNSKIMKIRKCCMTTIFSTAVALQKKWKSIRGCFTREVCRQKHLKSGSGGGTRKSEYLFFQQLQFLKPVVTVKESEHDADQGSVDAEENSEVLQRPNKNKRTKNSSTDNENDKFLETLQRSIEIREKHEANSEDEDRLFMLSLVGTLKKVPSQRKLATKIKMMTLLENAIRINSPGTYHGHAGASHAHAGASHGHPEPSYGRPGISYGNPYSECSRSQPHQTDTYHSGFSTLPGGSEMTPSIQSPLSTVSEESSLLDMY